MRIVPGWTALCAGVLLFPAFLASTAVLAQSTASVVSLDPTPNPAHGPARKGEASFANPPANFHGFAAARVGEDAAVEPLTLRFASPGQLISIQSTKDFPIEPGGSCSEERFYLSGETCTVLIRFSPQGPGRRLGKLTIRTTASNTSGELAAGADTSGGGQQGIYSNGVMVGLSAVGGAGTSADAVGIGLGGYGYAPVVSFIPSVISTVPGTYPSSTGLLSGAKNLTVAGDVLYIADIAKSLIRQIDSSGTITNTGEDFTTVTNIAVDNFGNIWGVSAPGSTYYFSIYQPWGGQTAYGTAYVATTCTSSAPCALGTVGMSSPGQISIDANDNLFMEEKNQGALEMPVGAYSGGGTLNLWHLSDEYAYDSGSAATFAVDANDNLYTYYSYAAPTACYILQEPLYGAETGSPTFTRVAGASKCGFSGDGGQARNAEIGTAIGEMAFDLAGNLYFSDTANQRIRRVDSSTGIIRTIAGTGTAGYTGDGGPGLAAELSSPTGVAVDSQGQVYVISSTTANGTAQVVRVVGVVGDLAFGPELKGIPTAARQVTVSNTGNSTLILTSAVITGSNPGDFSIDPKTTTCNLSAGGTLGTGQTCKVGIIFKPTVGTYRNALFVLNDNTVTNSNTVELFGKGTLPVPQFTITSPAAGSSGTPGTVTFAVSVKSSSSPAPTGKVTFSVNGSKIGSAVALSAGTASVVLTETTTGPYTLSAAYGGDANYSSANVSETYTVTP